MYGSVKVWQEIISLPTWTTGAEDPNPMFLEKRVYQGSSGSVYPYGVMPHWEWPIPLSFPAWMSCVRVLKRN